MSETHDIGMGVEMRQTKSGEHWILVYDGDPFFLRSEQILRMAEIVKESEPGPVFKVGQKIVQKMGELEFVYEVSKVRTECVLLKIENGCELNVPTEDLKRWITSGRCKIVKGPISTG